ncbi:MAG: YncE family protein [Janthinobacterium lividum]
MKKDAGKRRSKAVVGTEASTAVLCTLATLGLLGCGQTYRPVVSAINPVGPAGQPTKYAIAVSSPSTGTNGLLTLVDFSGDSVIATPEILPNPTYLAVLASGAEAYAINGENSLSAIPLTSPTALLTSVVVQTALPTDPPANASSISAFTLGTAARVLLPEAGRSSVAVLTAGSPALQQEIAVSANPVYVVGTDTTPRAYVISNGNGTGIGQVAAIEGSSLSISATIPVGIDPVFGVETADVRRAFILNHGSGTVSVINVTNNALDNANPVLPATGTLGVNPIWADLSTATNELLVLSAGNGTDPGTLSVVSIPLCNTAAQPTNPSCDATNPTDGAGFGTVLASIPVGVNAAMVSVLADGTQAYVVNQGNGTVQGSVTVINLTSNTVVATIPGAAATSPGLTPVCPSTVGSAACVYGHPATVAATTGTPTGKVYITSPDSNYMTVLETDTDAVDTHINLQGAGVRVRVSAP